MAANELKSMRWKLFLLSIVKIPMIGFVKPRLLKIDENQVKMKIRLRRRTKNHLNSMYFGVLAVGADVAAGIHAFYFSEKMGRKVSFAFKGMNAEFLMRAESDVIFQSDEGQLVKAAMEKSRDEEVRVNQPIKVKALNNSGEEVAIFEMVVSVRVK